MISADARTGGPTSVHTVPALLVALLLLGSLGSAQAAPPTSVELQREGATLLRADRHREAVQALKRAVATADDEDARWAARLDLAAAYLVQSNRVWAIRTLDATPPPARADLATRREALLGTALVESGRADDALALLERTPSASDDDEAAGWRALALGRARLADGDGRGARAAFSAAERSAAQRGDMGLSNAAATLTALALEVDNPEPEFVAASAATGVEFDSNALFDPELSPAGSDETGDDDGADAVESPARDLAAGRTFIRAALGLRPLNTGRHLLAGDASFYRSLHFANADAQQFDYTEISGTVRYAHRFTSGTAPADGVDHALQLRYLFSLGLLEGGDLLLESDTFVWQERHGGEASWTMRPEDWLDVRLSYGFERRMYADTDRDAWVHIPGAAVTMTLLDDHLYLALEAGAQVDTARGAHYDAAGPRLAARATVLLPWDLQLFGTTSWYHAIHHGSSGYFEDADGGPLERVDDVLRLSAGLGRRFFDGRLSVSLSYQWNFHASTAPTFDYERHVTTLTVGWRLGPTLLGGSEARTMQGGAPLPLGPDPERAQALIPLAALPLALPAPEELRHAQVEFMSAFGGQGAGAMGGGAGGCGCIEGGGGAAGSWGGGGATPDIGGRR